MPAEAPHVLVASDDHAVHDDVDAAVGGPDVVVRHVRAGVEVLPSVLDSIPDLVILDLQIGNMGGMAVCMNLRLEEGAGRLVHIPTPMLLDRRADVFLAKRSGADGWLVKPINPIRLRRSVEALLDGGTYHDDTAVPVPIAVPPSGAVG